MGSDMRDWAEHERRLELEKLREQVKRGGADLRRHATVVDPSSALSHESTERLRGLELVEWVTAHGWTESPLGRAVLARLDATSARLAKPHVTEGIRLNPRS